MYVVEPKNQQQKTMGVWVGDELNILWPDAYRWPVSHLFADTIRLVSKQYENGRCLITLILTELPNELAFLLEPFPC
jgi:hypothetical protein